VLVFLAETAVATEAVEEAMTAVMVAMMTDMVVAEAMAVEAGTAVAR